MPVIKKTVSKTSNEQSFLEELYDAFLEIDDVTLSPTKENIGNFFVDTSSGYSFTLTYKNAIQITFTRNGTLSTRTTLRFTISVGGTSIPSSYVIWSMSSSSSLLYNETATRIAKFIFVISDNAIEMGFFKYDADYFAVSSNSGSDKNNNYYLFIPIAENSVTTYLYKSDITNVTSVSDKTFYKMDENVPYKIAQSFNYSVPNNGIQIRDCSTLLSNSERVIDIDGLINCTTVPVNTVLTIGNKEYFSLGTDCIVEI